MQKPKTWMKVVTVAAPLSVIGVVFLSLQINKWSKQWLDKKANENPLYSVGVFKNLVTSTLDFTFDVVFNIWNYFGI